MIDAHEHVVSTQPFTVSRRVRWADCDPAGVAYAGRYVDYMLDTVMHFLRHTKFGPEAPPDCQDNVGLPYKHLDMMFLSAVSFGRQLDIVVSVAAIRQHTFDLLIRCFLPDGTSVFSGAFSPICIDAQSREKLSIPVQLRDTLSLHMIQQDLQK